MQGAAGERPVHDTDSHQLSVRALCRCRHWGSCRVSSTPHHARDPLPRAVSACEALQDLPPPTEPTRTGAQPLICTALTCAPACGCTAIPCCSAVLAPGSHCKSSAI